MKITISVPKLTFYAGIIMALIGGCTDIDHTGWMNWVLMIAGAGLMALVGWANAQKRKAKEKTA